MRTSENAKDMLPGELVDAVVIGGGAAGLSGALMLARSRRSVVVVDSGTPRNAPAAGVHGLLGLDGTPPAELLRRGREEVGRGSPTTTSCRSNARNVCASSS
jgi:thioredoxin reductase